MRDPANDAFEGAHILELLRVDVAVVRRERHIFDGRTGVLFLVETDSDDFLHVRDLKHLRMFTSHESRDITSAAGDGKCR